MWESIWTACAGTSEIAPLRSRPWRVVEAQHVIATRKLVDSVEEHELLEELLESAKPPPASDEPRALHYLLTTPFRYPPLRHGSRFGARWERGIWYGSERLAGAFSEVAYYRLRFLEDTEARLEHVEVELSAFRVTVSTERGADLTEPPFVAHESTISSPTSYAGSQQLGGDMRQAGVEAFRFRSARDPKGATNMGIFAPAAFASVRPESLTTWNCVVTPTGVDFTRKNLFQRAHQQFPRSVFLVDGTLPRPSA